MALDSEIAQMLGEQSEESEEATSSSAETEESKETASEETSEESAETAEASSEEGGGETETAETEESEESEESKTEVQLLKEQNQKLQEQINQLSRGQQTQTQDQDSEQDSQASRASADPLKDVDPLGEYDFNNLMEDQEQFKKWAKDFGAQIYNKAQEDFFQQVPQIIQSTATEQIQLREKAQQFYKDNEDLANVKDFVAQVTNQVHSEHPDWGFDDVLSEAADRARDALGLEKKANQAEKDSKKKKPSLPNEGGSKKSGKRQGSDSRTELEREFDAMLNH